MKLHLASGNAHKVAEFQALARASGLDVTIVSAREAGGMPEVVEDSGTFSGNAAKKARALKSILPGETWVLADDSGLCVDALGGAPGVESAYYAGPSGDSAANLRKLVEVMRAVPQEKRGAYFTCVLVLMGPGGIEEVFEGKTPGSLLFSPRGGQGFGYDPLFVPTGSTLTFAEMSEPSKNAISHRGRAWRPLAEFLATRIRAGSAADPHQP
jgi:XTP/dITP diphosphohydrolase